MGWMDKRNLGCTHVHTCVGVFSLNLFTFFSIQLK